MVRTSDFFCNFGRHILGIFIIILRRHKVPYWLPSDPKWLTVSDLEMPFYAKICFRRRFDYFLLPRFRRQLSEKKWRYSHILSATKCLPEAGAWGVNKQCRGRKRLIFNAISCLVFQTFENSVKVVVKASAWTLSNLCRYTFYTDTCGGSLERTRQTTLGAILVDSHVSVAVYFC